MQLRHYKKTLVRSSRLLAMFPFGALFESLIGHGLGDEKPGQVALKASQPCTRMYIFEFPFIFAYNGPIVEKAKISFTYNAHIAS